MKTVRGCVFSILYAWRSIVLMQAALIAIVIGIGWQSGWREVSEYTNALLLAGIGAIAAGAFSLWGGYNSTRSAGYMYAASAGPDDFSQTMKRGNEYNRQSFSCFVLLGIVGVLTMALSLIGLALFG
jgi:hypothetical protein